MLILIERTPIIIFFKIIKLIGISVVFTYLTFNY